MEVITEQKFEQKCTNVFAHSDEERSKVFTNLWIQIINKKETESQISIANTDVLDL